MFAISFRVRFGSFGDDLERNRRMPNSPTVPCVGDLYVTTRVLDHRWVGKFAPLSRGELFDDEKIFPSESIVE